MTNPLEMKFMISSDHNEVVDIFLRESQIGIPKLRNNNVLTESIFEDDLLSASIRKTNGEALYDTEKRQYVLDFIDSDTQLKDTVAELEAIDLTLREILISLPKKARDKAY